MNWANIRLWWITEVVHVIGGNKQATHIKMSASSISSSSSARLLLVSQVGTENRWCCSAGECKGSITNSSPKNPSRSIQIRVWKTRPVQLIVADCYWLAHRKQSKNTHPKKNPPNFSLSFTEVFHCCRRLPIHAMHANPTETKGKNCYYCSRNYLCQERNHNVVQYYPFEMQQIAGSAAAKQQLQVLLLPHPHPTHEWEDVKTKQESRICLWHATGSSPRIHARSYLQPQPIEVPALAVEDLISKHHHHHLLFWQCLAMSHSQCLLLHYSLEHYCGDCSCCCCWGPHWVQPMHQPYCK